MGKGYAEAYIDAGYAPCVENERGTAQNAYNIEHRLSYSPKIQAEIARLKKMAEEGAVLDRQSRQAKLTEIALDDTEKTDNRLRAFDMLNRMSGDYTDNIRSESVNKVQLSYAEKKALLEEQMHETA